MVSSTSAQVSPPVAGPGARHLLDASSTPMHPAARSTLEAAWRLGWADPRHRHAEGRQARRLLDQARAVIADGLGVRPDEVVLTSGGPAALRLGLHGLRYAARRTGQRVLASAVEQSTVLTTIRYAADRAGAPALAGVVPVDGQGRVDLEQWSAALAVEGTAVACLQHANGEVGTVQPLAAARAAARERGIPLLVDATASLGRLDPPTAGTDYDALAGDARSWGGPPGVGVLVLPAGTRWRRDGPPSELEGGRTDVEPVVPLVLAAAEAWLQTAATAAAEQAEARALVDRIRAGVAELPETEVVGDPVDRLPHVVTFSCLLADGETLLDELDRRGLAVGSGSACTSSTLEPSHVLAAMGALTHGNIRITLPLAAVAPDRSLGVDRLLEVLPDVLAGVRARVVRQ
ncbi:MAG TPA: aminotransferase class V-fold PLP-dependent enzyme [Dermatophilaceae bacterium]|nr:aminotransferase class V-fold PLP-dependent enzyme [Dermatophilaceae bacterium]